MRRGAGRQSQRPLGPGGAAASGGCGCPGCWLVAAGAVGEGSSLEPPRSSCNPHIHFPPGLRNPLSQSRLLCPRWHGGLSASQDSRSGCEIRDWPPEDVLRASVMRAWQPVARRGESGTATCSTSWCQKGDASRGFACCLRRRLPICEDVLLLREDDRFVACRTGQVSQQMDARVGGYHHAISQVMNATGQLCSVGVITSYIRLLLTSVGKAICVIMSISAHPVDGHRATPSPPTGSVLSQGSDATAKSAPCTTSTWQHPRP